MGTNPPVVVGGEEEKALSGSQLSARTGKGYDPHRRGCMNQRNIHTHMWPERKRLLNGRKFTKRLCSIAHFSPLRFASHRFRDAFMMMMRVTFGAVQFANFPPPNWPLSLWGMGARTWAQCWRKLSFATSNFMLPLIMRRSGSSAQRNSLQSNVSPTH